MTYFQLYKELRNHLKLAEKRQFDYDKNKFAKYLMLFMSIFVIAYIIMFAVILSMAANESRHYTPLEFFFGVAPFILILDFFIRFIAQQTPAQLVKPYSLLPISKYACIDCFLFNNILSTTQLLWLFLTIPFAIMSLVFTEGFFFSLLVIFVFQIFISANGLWYVLFRSLISRSLIWWILPVCIYIAEALPWIIFNFKTFFQFYGYIGSNIILAMLIGLLLLAILFLINRKVQYALTYNETSQENASSQKVKVREFSALEHFGIIGEFLKLEIKSIMRNKNPRSTVLFSCIFSVFLSLIIAYTDIYNNPLMMNFWLVYIFVLTGATILIKIMCYEGNYIDVLMVHKEQIYNLLRAKYFFFCSLLILPFIVLTPTIISGKFSLLSIVSMATFVAGPVFFMLMQLATVNKNTAPLNTKLVSKGNVESNWFMIVVEMIAMFAPVALLSLLSLFCSETVTNIILLSIGIAFIATNKYWIHNIYVRFMRKRYENMEGFRASR